MATDIYERDEEFSRAFQRAMSRAAESMRKFMVACADLEPCEQVEADELDTELEQCCLDTELE